MALPQNNRELKKDTIYIDVDDEITTIIEKLNNSPEKIVALVLPKRASVLQSTVNMKLLKRSAANAKKHVVLITSEAGLLPLAGAVGMLVASSLQSKPAIPASPDMAPREQVIDEETGEAYEDFDTKSAADVPIGTLAGTAGLAAAASAAEPVAAGSGFGAASARPANSFSEPETIELGDDDDTPAQDDSKSAAIPPAAAAVPKKGKNKKLLVPNFNKFRLILGVGLLVLILLVGGFFYADSTLSKAVVTIKTNSTDVSTKANVTLDPKASELDLASDTLPAKIETKTQNGSQQVSASGQKNNGTKASGTVTMSSQVCGTAALNSDGPANVPSGTGISSGGKTYITQNTTTFPDSGTFKSNCVTYQATGSTTVVSQSAGIDYNIDPATFAVAGRPEVSAKSSAKFDGGTDNIVKVVAQADIDSAKAKLTSGDTSGIKTELATKLKTDGYTALPSSLVAGEPTITPSAAVGDQTDTVTVTSATVYTMYGFKEADITSLVTASVKDQIDASKQQILENGASKAKYTIASTTASGPLQVTLTASSVAGPDIKADTLKNQLVGKKTGEAQTLLKAIPGVTDVSVKYAPFWVSKIPGKTTKIELVIVKASGDTTTLTSGNDGN